MCAGYAILPSFLLLWLQRLQVSPGKGPNKKGCHLPCAATGPAWGGAGAFSESHNPLLGLHEWKVEGGGLRRWTKAQGGAGRPRWAQARSGGGCPPMRLGSTQVRLGELGGSEPLVSRTRFCPHLPLVIFFFFINWANHYMQGSTKAFWKTLLLEFCDTNYI